MNAAVSFPDLGASQISEIIPLAFDACPESLAIVANGDIVYANPAFAHLFGLAARQSCRRWRWVEAVGGDDLI